ncbi:lisH domain and HEAT repeat-containing protein KIAA1468 [Tanacetum coccineum]
MLCVLSVLFAGVFGSPSKHEVLTEYLRNLLVQSTKQEGQSAMHCADVYNSVRSYGCMFEEHHNLDFHILWEMVVSSNMDLKINAANLLKAIIWALDNPRGAETLPPGLVECEFDLHLRRLWDSNGPGWSMEITGVVVVPAEANRQWLHWNFVGGVPEKLGRLLKAFMSVSGSRWHAVKSCNVQLVDEISRYDKYYQTPRVWLTGYDEKVGAQTHIYHHVQRHGMHDVAIGISSKF